MGKETAATGDVVVRERLLAAALELFTRKGYSATSVREIVAAAGVTKPVLYYYFGNKEGLFLELMNHAHGVFEGVVVEITALPGSVRERITRFCLSLFDDALNHVSIVRLIYSTHFGPPQGAPVCTAEQIFGRMLTIIGDLIREGVEVGELKRVNEDDAAWSIAACFNIVLEEQLCSSPPRVGRDALERMLNLAFAGFNQGEK
jgi:AcrR family transcriptional regulator